MSLRRPACGLFRPRPPKAPPPPASDGAGAGAPALSDGSVWHCGERPRCPAAVSPLGREWRVVGWASLVAFPPFRFVVCVGGWLLRGVWRLALRGWRPGLRECGGGNPFYSRRVGQLSADKCCFCPLAPQPYGRRHVPHKALPNAVDFGACPPPHLMWDM